MKKNKNESEAQGFRSTGLASPGIAMIEAWLKTEGKTPFAFQRSAWQSIVEGKSGLVNAPTGFGKTYSVFLGWLAAEWEKNEIRGIGEKKTSKVRLLWITPLRALAKDIGRAMEEVLQALDIPWKVGIRNGDTENKQRTAQKNTPPEILIITPESLHLLLAQKGYPQYFSNLSLIAVDEWHELMGSKRGVQTELAIAQLNAIAVQQNKSLQVWGISATIGNLEEAMETLLFPVLRRSPSQQKDGVIIRAEVKKITEVRCIYPDEIEKYPWSGHLGIKLADKVIPVLDTSITTLLFINTRGMSERWYQVLLDQSPELAGAIALHHGSIRQDLRTWVEEALHTGTLKLVVCTASLDLGVDFRPVQTVIQVGSPKGVARFLQRAGRSGHQPNAPSIIYFLPTHSLELLEAAALEQAIEDGVMESKPPLMNCYDVLIQFLGTLAISEGFVPEQIFETVKNTYCFQYLSKEEWDELLHFLVNGGNALQQYDEYQKLQWIEGKYRMPSRGLAMRHRMHIGTIVSDAMLQVKFVSGGYVGTVEEWFISKLIPGDVFTLAGRNLELVGIKDMTVQVKKSNAKKSIVPSWMGGRIPLTAHLGAKLREQLNQLAAALKNPDQIPHLRKPLQQLMPLMELQATLSRIPKEGELLIEHIETKDGFHLFVYPFEGRLVHEAMAAILAHRISQILPISFSFVMNDYGFELLSDQPIPVDDGNVYELFSPVNIMADIQKSVNSTEMAKRKFRDIAVIGGLIFQGYPGAHKKARHLQSSASLLFNVFKEYDPNNILLKQAYNEVFEQQMEETRLRDMLQRIAHSKIVITYPTQLTPFSFPIKVDSMRENISSEKLEDRIRKMQIQLEKDFVNK